MDKPSVLAVGAKLYEVANIYRDCQELERALDYYAQAQPLLAETRVNLRACFHYDRAIAHDLCRYPERATNDFKLAQQFFEEFIRLEPNDETLPNVRILLEQVKEQLKLRENVDILSDDYQASITARPWAQTKFPLQVCIEGFDDATKKLIWKGFEEWMTASKRLRCQLVSESNGADILVVRTTASDQLPFNAGGRTLYDEDESTIDSEPLLKRVTILLYRPFAGTGDLSTGRLNDFLSLVMHEVGHALGIDGHSPNGADLMYWKAQWLKLSDRDKNTMRIIYECR